MNYTNKTVAVGIDFGIGIEEKYFNAFLLSSVMIITLLGNSVALHAFFIATELKRPTYYFIACLCISDIMIATLSMPLWVTDVLLNWDHRFPNTLRDIYSGFDIFCGTWSIMSLAMISIERYICITYALHYWRIMTKRRVYYIFLFVFVYSLIVTIVNFNKYEEGTKAKYIKQCFIVLGSFIIPVLIKVFSYSKIYAAARKHTNQINELKKMSRHINEDVDENESTASSSIRKGNHSDSNASWACSPLVTRKRQTTQNRILVLSDVDEDDPYEKNDTTKIVVAPIRHAKQNVKKSVHKLICSKKKQKYDVEYTASNNVGDGRIKHEEKSLLNGKKQILAKQDSDDSIISTIRPHNHRNEIDQNKKVKSWHNATNNKPSRRKNTHANSVEERDRIYCEVQNRKRSFSCPVPVGNISKTRISLGPNDAIDTSQTISVNSQTISVNESNDTSSSTNRLSRVFKSFSKWSPSNSPMAFRKSLRRSSNNNNNTTKNNQNRHLQRIRRFKKELRAAKIVALIMGAFFLCWLPFMIAILFDTFIGTVSMRFIMIAKDLHYLNSAINPILYVVLNKVYRKAILRVIKNIKTRFNIT